MEVWQNEKLQWEHKPTGQVFPRYFEFSQTFMSVSILYGNIVKNVFYYFYKITCRKLKCGNSLLYQSGNSLYRSRWRLRWRIMVWPASHVFHTVIGTQLLANQSSNFSKSYFIIVYMYIVMSRYSTDVGQISRKLISVACWHIFHFFKVIKRNIQFNSLDVAILVG